MKTQILFPNKSRWIGWILLIPSSIIGVLYLFFDLEFAFLDCRILSVFEKGIITDDNLFTMSDANLTSTLAGVLFIIGAILVAFSKEKEEDEYIARVRLDSLLWATYINYAVLIICFLIFYASGFFYVMIFNMFTILIFFIIRYNYILYKSRKGLRNEK